MPDTKISALSTYAEPILTDLLPIVDVTTSTTKKITYEELMHLPHGSYSSASSQACTAGSTANVITYTDIEDEHFTTLMSGSSRIQLQIQGTYLITFSAVGRSTTTSDYLEIWLVVSGSIVPRTNTVSRFVGAANERIITVTYIYPFTTNQFFELYMYSNQAGTEIVASGSTAGPPPRPACPSVIVTVNKIAK